MTPDQIPGYFDFHKTYDLLAQTVPPGGTAVEIGVWKGKSLAYLAGLLTNKKARVVGIDTFNASGCDQYLRDLHENGDNRTQFQQCRANLNACGFGWVELIESDAITAARLFNDNSVDLLFIDDLHVCEHVKREIKAWQPKMRFGGIIAGDDYPLVKDAVHEMFKRVEVIDGAWLAL